MSLLSGPTSKKAVSEQPVLLTGQSIAALGAAAREMAQGNLCEDPQPSPHPSPYARRGERTACKKCLPCRQVEKQLHPDFIYLGAEDDISIKALRGLLDRVSHKAQSGRRVVVLEAVERLSIPAVNALLKTLEEPAADTRFVLTTLYPGRLPATLRSRCQVVRVNHPHPNPLPMQGEGEIEGIARELGELLKKEGPSPSLRRAFMRLRDYYRITSAKGNTKLARDVLRYSYELGKRL